MSEAGNSVPWHEQGNAPDGQVEPRGHSQQTTEKQATKKGIGATRCAVGSGVAALLTPAT